MSSSSRKRNQNSLNSRESMKTKSAVNPDGSFEVVDFILKHFQMESWDKYEGLTYTPQEIIGLLDMITAQFADGKSLAKIAPPVTIVGDLNGNFHDLIRIFNIREGVDKEDENKQVFATQKFVFLGDYTENSKFNLETICLLFALKVFYDQRYILLRGHQEIHMPNEKSEFQDQIMKKFPKNHTVIWPKFCQAFSLMPVAAVVGGKILCVHGGISPEIKNSVDEVKKVPRKEKMDDLTPMARDFMFACPVDDDGIGADSDQPVYFMSVKRDYTKLFNEAAVKEFCAITKIELIVRSHEVPANGFRFFAEKRMLTIFSTAMYNDYKNKSAIVKVGKTGLVSIILMRVPKKKGAKKVEQVEKLEEVDAVAEEKPKTVEEKAKKSERTVEKKEQSTEKTADKVDEPEKTKTQESERNKKDNSAEKKKKKRLSTESKESGAKSKERTPLRPSKELESVFDNIEG